MNNNIQETYVSFPVAKLLKEKGFEVPTDRYFKSNGELTINSEDSEGNEREYHFASIDFVENWNREGMGDR